MQSLFLAAADPASHVYNHYFLKNEAGYWLWSGHQGNLILSGIILCLVGWWVAKKVSTGPESEGHDRYITKNRFAHMIEVIAVYLREEVARPQLGARTEKIMPFLWTLFFFILVNNLLGLVPFLEIMHFINPQWGAEHRTPLGGTATQNIWVTGFLAIVAGIFYNLVAVRHLGVIGFFKHMTAGAPFPFSIFIFFLELLSQILIKPFALALRLFANMTAGHILLATLFSFAGMVVGAHLLIQGPVTIIAILGGFGIMLLEIFVAFMQAFIFMFLTTVFIALMDHHDEHEHEQHHGVDSEYPHAMGHEHA